MLDGLRHGEQTDVEPFAVPVLHYDFLARLEDALDRLAGFALRPAADKLERYRHVNELGVGKGLNADHVDFP